jgi:flagellum-specific ATP synthase
MNVAQLIHIAHTTPSICQGGRVTQVVGLVIEASGPAVSIGECCRISGKPPVYAEVVGFRNNRILMMPLGNMEGIAPGSRVMATNEPFTVRVGDGLLGRVLNAMGEPIDNKNAPWPVCLPTLCRASAFHNRWARAFAPLMRS